MVTYQTSIVQPGRTNVTFHCHRARKIRRARSGPEDRDLAAGDDTVYGSIMRFNRYGRPKFPGVQQRDHELWRPDARQRPVKRTTAPPETPATPIHRERRHEHDGGLDDRVDTEPGAGGFVQAKAGGCESAGGGVGVVERPIEITITENHRQEHPGRLCGEGGR